MLMDDDSMKVTIIYKIPFFLLGVLLGQLVVWVSLQWVPLALTSARLALNS